jgi:hypothetical protein
MAFPPDSRRCVYKRFDDQIHGFLGARGDYQDPKVAAAATEGIELISHFLKANLGSDTCVP